VKRYRLNRYLALAGIASRRASDEIIKAGRVKVDGETVLTPGMSVEVSSTGVELDGMRVSLAPSRIYLLNKPAGILSTVKDPHGGKNVLDLARDAGVKERVYPVGRLDKKSRGLLLLSNDGDLSYRLLHPRFKVEKVYEVRINLPITRTQMKRFERGLTLSDGQTSPCKIRALRGRAIYEVTLREGRKRQIRRMFESLQRRVVDLRRVAMGPLKLGGLPEGEIRPLSPNEIAGLKDRLGLS
jgi:pseudouridine synthase